jgi:hypothetical protein
MPSLLEQQSQFAAALTAPAGGAPPPILAAPSAQHFAVYRNNLRANYRGALGASYPVVRELVGPPFFHAAVDEFVAAHPSTGGDLNVYGAEFGDFLARYAPARDLPYLPDVARLEWAIDEAGRAPDATANPDLVLGALATLPADALPQVRFRLEPSCRFLASAHPVLRIWQVNQPGYDGDPTVAFDAPADTLRIRREADGRVVVERQAPGDHAWLNALTQGAPLGAALDAAQGADPHFDLGEALRTAIAEGVITAVIPADCQVPAGAATIR